MSTSPAGVLLSRSSIGMETVQYPSVSANKLWRAPMSKLHRGCFGACPRIGFADVCVKSGPQLVESSGPSPSARRSLPRS